MRDVNVDHRAPGHLTRQSHSRARRIRVTKQAASLEGNLRTETQQLTNRAPAEPFKSLGSTRLRASRVTHRAASQAVLADQWPEAHTPAFAPRGLSTRPTHVVVNFDELADEGEILGVIGYRQGSITAFTGPSARAIEP
jgi:hypothetical protein